MKQGNNRQRRRAHVEHRVAAPKGGPTRKKSKKAKRTSRVASTHLGPKAAVDLQIFSNQRCGLREQIAQSSAWVTTPVTKAGSIDSLENQRR